MSPVPQSFSTPLDHQLSGYRYVLPEALIAQNPAIPRDSSRLLVVEKANVQHRHFRDLVDLLQPGDLLVLNNTRVIPARLFGRKLIDTPKATDKASDSLSYGAPVEVLLLEPLAEDCWLALVKPGRRLKPGTSIAFVIEGVDSKGLGDELIMTADVESRDEKTSGRILKLTLQGEYAKLHSIDDAIHLLGNVPLPPYITKSESLPEQYQTVFAQKQGAIAAPTAGLHFTERLLTQLTEKGIQTAEVTLHVGIGTFRPVEVVDIETHQMHQERIEVPIETVKKIRETKANGGRVIAVGTTSTRALEGAAAACETLEPYSGKTEIFIYPGYQWQVIDGMITNFHLPESSLLMMVSALIGRERLMQVYEEAIAQQYRFYSFGDAMLILPEAAV